jgi:hypothetical protein
MCARAVAAVDVAECLEKEWLTPFSIWCFARKIDASHVTETCLQFFCFNGIIFIFLLQFDATGVAAFFPQAYAARALAPPKQVVHANTRLARSAFAPNTAVGAAHGGRSSSHVDPNGARIGVSSFDSIVGGGGGGSIAGFDGGNGTPRINGFTLPGTPAIAPGADGASPLITWGMIVGTPQHIVAEDPAESLMQREMAGAGNGTRRARKMIHLL